MIKWQKECEALRDVAEDMKRYACQVIPLPGDLADIVYFYLWPEVIIIDAIEHALCSCEDVYFDASGKIQMYCRDCPMPGHHVMHSYNGIKAAQGSIPTYLWKSYCVVYQSAYLISEDPRHQYMFLCMTSVYNWINAVARAGP